LGRDTPFGDGSDSGPTAPPGKYQVQLKIGKTKITHSFEITKDPRLETSAEDFALQFELWSKIGNQVSATNSAINKVRKINLQITELLSRVIFTKSAPGKSLIAVRKAAKSLRKQLSTIENQLIQNQYETPSDRLRHPTMLKERMEALVSVVSVSDAAPPQQAFEVYEELRIQIETQLTQLKMLEEKELPQLNKQIEQVGTPMLQA